MIHRQISLYWSSISLSNTIAALVVWSLSFWKKPISRRVKFARQLSKLYSEGAWYLFGSARSSITCFLKAVVKPEDEVIVSAYTCLAVPTAVVAAGAVPVYVDINSKTLAIDEHKIWCSITNKTKVIIVQHTLGNPAEVMKIREKAHKLGILILEDCALAIGTKINGCNVGTFGDAAIFSMELSKTLSSGWGGLLLVRNQSLIQEVENIYSSIEETSITQSTRDLLQTIISTWCTHPVFYLFPGRYIIWLLYKIGLFRNSTPKTESKGVISKDFMRKMGGAQMLLAMMQWKNFDKVTEVCADNHALFTKKLTSLGYDVHVPKGDNNIKVVSNRVSFLVDNRPQFIEFFRKKHINLGVWFDEPISPMPTEDIFNYTAGEFPVSERVSKYVVNIPCHNRLSIHDKNKIIECINAYNR